MNKQYRCSLSQLLFSYWKGEERKKAWLMGILIAALTIAAVYMTLLLNDWFNSFYSALQNYDRQAIYHGLIQFTGYAFAYIAFSVYAGASMAPVDDRKVSGPVDGRGYVLPNGSLFRRQRG